MKIAAVLGSPRTKSNSATLTRMILDSAGQNGAKTQSFILNDLAYKGCQGCEACKSKLDRCILDDDLTGVLDAVKEADAVVLATPNYFGEVSGQFKSFFDRTYSFLGPDFTSRLTPGKKAVFVFAQGYDNPNSYPDVYPRYETWLERFGFSTRILLRMTGPRPEDSVVQRPDLMEQARQIGRDLTS